MCNNPLLWSAKSKVLGTDGNRSRSHTGRHRQLLMHFILYGKDKDREK